MPDLPEPEELCERALSCLCHVPKEKRAGRMCDDCKAGRHKSWQTGEIIDKDDPI